MFGMTRFFILATLIGLQACAPSGFDVHVKNVGAATTSDITLRVNGESVSAGRVGPGETRAVCVVPAGESDLRLIIEPEAREPTIVGVDAYLEPPGGSPYYVEMDEDRVLRVTQDGYDLKFK
jgi:hypothetical protein